MKVHRVKVVIDTARDVSEFVNIANTFEENVYLEDGTGFRANAKSFMGVLYGKVEFETLYVVSDSDQLSNKFFKFIV